MSKYISLLLMLIVLGSGHGRSAQHNSNPELHIRSIQFRADKSVETLTKDIQDKPVKTNEVIYPNSYIIKINRSRKMRVQEKRGFLFDKYDNLPAYERLGIRILFELDQLTQKLYRRFFNYYKLEFNDDKQNLRNEITEYATLGVFLSIVLMLYSIMLYVYYN